jgi:uncharacterized membrane protein (Fun14 family)
VKGGLGDAMRVVVYVVVGVVSIYMAVGGVLAHYGLLSQTIYGLTDLARSPHQWVSESV